MIGHNVLWSGHMPDGVKFYDLFIVRVNVSKWSGHMPDLSPWEGRIALFALKII